MKILGAIALAATFLLTACEQSLEPVEAWEMMFNSVVEVQTEGRTMCTATQIGPTAYLSAGHCIVMGDATHIKKNDEVREITSYHYGFEPGVDWAVFYTDSPIANTWSMTLACTEEVYPTMEIATLGHPGPFLYDFTMGRVTGNERYPRRENSISRAPGSDYFSDNIVGGGASGSAVISMETGGIIGIVVEAFMNNLRTSFRTGVQEIEPVCQFINKTRTTYETK